MPRDEPLVMALVRAAAPWEVPGHHMYGGWHSWMTPEEHTAILKRWNERYRAEIVDVGPGTQ